MTLKYLSHKQCDGDWLITCRFYDGHLPAGIHHFFGDGTMWFTVLEGIMLRCLEEENQQLTDICARLRWEEKRGVLE